MIFACLALVIFGECRPKKEKGWMYTGYVHVDVTQLL